MKEAYIRLATAEDAEYIRPRQESDDPFFADSCAMCTALGRFSVKATMVEAGTVDLGVYGTYRSILGMCANHAEVSDLPLWPF